uniref:Membrane integral NOTCH2 associated receptor 1 n=1 Tax=Neogobius melanostomus TaxID=47308 RepID=A0A8C6SKH6_9GOBI
MSDALQEQYPEVLLGILEELAGMRQWLSFQDLCRMVSSRFPLEHLVELRSLLFAAATRDPCFPATLFRERVTTRGQRLSPIGVAADIVTIFNLIQMTGGGFCDVPAMSPRPENFFKNFRAQSDSDGRGLDRLPLPPRGYSARKRGSLPPDPLSLLSSSPPARARAVSFDLPHTTVLFPPWPPHQQAPPGAMGSLYLPLETDSESSGESNHADVFEPEPESSVDHKRSIFKKDFHNHDHVMSVCPLQVTVQSESPSPGSTKTGFDNRSLDVIPNPYPSPTIPHHSPKQTKHESLDDLQDSTYFGPGSVPDSWSPRHLHPPPLKAIWANKSHSLEDRIDMSSPSLDPRKSQPPRRSSPAISKLSGGGRDMEESLLREGEGFRAQATQTEPPDPRRLRSLVHADRLSFMTSLDDPEFCEDDISVIFRFLDDISMCGSTGVLHPDGALNQDTHEARRGRLGQLQRLFHSLESSDDGLKASVCKLLLRMSQIERQLESLAEVKSEISQVLSALQRLDEKIQQPLIAGGGRQGSSSGSRWLEPLSGVSSFMSHPVTPSENGSTEGKKEGVSRRASKNEEKATDVKPPLTLSNSARDWSVSYSKSKDAKATNGKLGKVRIKVSTTNLLSQKSSSLMEQVFNSSLFRSRDGSQGPHSSGKAQDTRAEDRGESRGRPVWTVDERESTLNAFCLPFQGQESLNPNNLEFWMDDLYTPGYDGLLRRSQATLRKAKICKLSALIGATVAIILIIVIPLCTVRK